jgi:serine/threonine-protein kinase HipA
MRRARIYLQNSFAGYLTETDQGYNFTYDEDFLQSGTAEPVSATLPLALKSFDSKTMIPFFDGLIPEGWLLDIAEKNWKLDGKDRMGLLLVCCKDCIGVIRVEGEIYE